LVIVNWPRPAAGVDCGDCCPLCANAPAIQGAFLFSLSLLFFLSLFLFTSLPSSVRSPLCRLSSSYIFSTKTPPRTANLSNSNKNVLYRDDGDLLFPLKVALSLDHDLSQECRKVSPFGTRRSTIILEDSVQLLLINILGFKFMHGLWTVVHDCE
jgi:hypothetical protein